ncbi:hypothetical protein D0A40_15215 [Xanthomonas campestris pv. raphani]|nr:hypothetical protein D0A40_15215 [Xanthomonas campestris pv. raphani]
MRGGSLRSGVGNRESGIGNGESGIGSHKSGWLGRGGGCWLWRWMPVIRAGYWPAVVGARSRAMGFTGTPFVLLTHAAPLSVRLVRASVSAAGP